MKFKKALKGTGKWAAIWALTNVVCYWSMWAARAVAVYFTQDPVVLGWVFAATFPLTLVNECGLVIYAFYLKAVKWRDKAANVKNAQVTLK